jgi:hypothetical protein
VAGPHKAPHHIGSHPTQSDHAQFHVYFLSVQSRTRNLQRRPFIV